MCDRKSFESSAAQHRRLLAVDVRERIPAICIAYHSSQECRHGYGGRFFIASESSSNLLSHFTQRPSTLPPLLQPISADKPLLRWQHNVTTASRHHLRAPQINELRRVRSAADEIVHQRRPQVSNGSPCSQPRTAATMRGDRARPCNTSSGAVPSHFLACAVARLRRPRAVSQRRRRLSSIAELLRHDAVRSRTVFAIHQWQRMPCLTRHQCIAPDPSEEVLSLPAPWPSSAKTCIKC